MNKNASISDLLNNYRKHIEKYQKKIKAIQDSCNHENNEAEYGSNSGNYDPSSDVWWINVKCLDCGKRMTFYSDSAFYTDKRWKIKRD